MTSTIKRVDAALLSAFLCGGAEYLAEHRAQIDALNVFPVPDGDTGVNMSLTVNSASQRISQESVNGGVSVVSNDFAKGALMGARGNSGVILSQIFRGFSMALADKTDCDAAQLAAAMQKGVDLSYKSVIKPVEGTILTVFRELVAAAQSAAEDGADICAMMDIAMAAGEKALANTPNQLPVLKEAGVVDAGGAGLLCFIQGGLKAVAGGNIKDFKLPAASVAAAPIKPANAAALDDISTADIEFAYCTQLLIKGTDLPVDTIREHLSQTPPGDSLLVVGDDSVIKIHFHNNHPGQVLEYCSQFGTLHDIIIDNMVDQHHENRAAADMTEADMPEEETVSYAAPAADAPLCGVVAICCGEGMHDLFCELGATVISGGQTMNPSAEDILNAVNANPAQQVVILPNNSNIILTADQVKSLSEKPVDVVKSKFVTQGLSAMLNYDPSEDAATNAENMSSVLSNVVNGELTYSVRPAKVNGFDIAENDILALLDGDIVSCGDDLQNMLHELVEKMVSANEDCEIITLYWGNDLGEEKAAELADSIAEAYPDHDVELYSGGQPLYYFLLSAE